MGKRVFILSYLVLVFLTQLNGQAREKISLNRGWKFYLEDKRTVEIVNLPHTWNAKDIIDEPVGYYRGIGWYSKKLFVAEDLKNKNLSLFFEAASIKATVYVNGKEALVHNGAFTGFDVPISSFLKFNDSNLVEIKVDNSKHLSDSIPPFSGDFSLMGGIYRDLWLVVTDITRFEGPLGSSGILFTTPYVDENSASFNLKLSLKGGNRYPLGLVSYQIMKDGRRLAGETTSVSWVISQMNFTFIGSIPKPVLWTPENPELYQLVMKVTDKDQNIIDQLEIDIGFRWFGINKNQEFLLNGKPYKLKGASRHQDSDKIGNAVPDELHWKDIKLMKDMGCNFIRIAHYPQDPAIYEACDKLGLISWSEIPIVDKVVNSEAFHRNSELMMKEMILQHYNHPSVAIWGYHNEVRNLDAYRLTAMAFESNLENGYFTNPLIKEMFKIPDILGYNVYEGWYRGKIETVPAFLHTLHKLYPAKPLMISEYGAGSSTNIHTTQPTIFDFSEEYQCLFQEPYLDEGEKYPWMIGWGIWNFIDFQRDGREDVQPNINNKGMVTTDRKPKDVYYLYKSRWSKDPFVYIAGKNWKERYYFVDDNNKAGIKIPVVVYSNQTDLKLFHNGRAVVASTGSKGSKGKFVFNIGLSEGQNQLQCKTANDLIADELNFETHFISPRSIREMKSGDQFSFNTGQSKTFYKKEGGKQTWLPDRPYKPGGWGTIGGKLYASWPGNKYWDGLRQGIHKPIALTNDEPVFQTFVEGLEAWKADLPDGNYRVSLYLCEPLNSSQRKNEARVMSIGINGEKWMDRLNMEQYSGLLSAIILDREVICSNGKGITISFIPHSGKTILNGIRIQKL